MQHTKKDYPLPGPADHFHDKESAKKIDAEKRELVVVNKAPQRFKSKTS